MRRAWGLLLAAVLPLWHDPALLAAHGDKIVQVWCLPALAPAPAVDFRPTLPLSANPAAAWWLLGSSSLLALILLSPWVAKGLPHPHPPSLCHCHLPPAICFCSQSCL
jgi:hypothetical protein